MFEVIKSIFIRGFQLNIIFAIFLLYGCGDLFEYSPYAVNFDEQDTHLNQKNILRLNTIEGDDVIRIAFTGDTHREYEKFERFSESVNCLKDPVDFVIHVGDIADFGLPKQYLWGNRCLRILDCPYFVCIGNHDLVGNGGDAYRQMFGTYNFSFLYKRVKFVFINTNGMEFGYPGNVPDTLWLDNQLRPADDFERAVVVFHVSPVSRDFDPVLKDPFLRTLARYNNVLFAVHGHYHPYEYYYPENCRIPFINVYGVEFEHYNVIEITGDKFNVETHVF